METNCKKNLLSSNKNKSQLLNYICFILITAFFVTIQTNAQPSGGPYGPLRQKYDLPKVSGKIYYISVDGKSEQSGELISKPTTIESAVERVKTGDAIVLRGGIYRTGNLIINQGIVIQPYADEQPILKGTYIASDWKNLGNGIWKTSWEHLFPSKPDTWWNRDRFGKETPMHRFNNDMVFIDGKFLQSVGCEGNVDENTFYIDYENKQVYIGVDPTNKLVEITAFDIAIKRTTGEVHGKKSDKIGPIIKGVTFTQYAYRALEVEGKEPEGISPETNHGKDVIGTTLEHCTISYCSRVAAYFRGDKLKIRHCKVTDTSTEGIYIIGSSDVLLEKNIFTRNNIEKITGYYPAAVKIFNQSYRVTCNDNLVIDLPYSNGIWYDVGNVDGVFVNNWIEGVGIIDRKFNKDRPWPSDNGFFFEISKGAICAGNVFVNCDQGIFVLNSSDVQIYNNTLVNSTVCIARNERTAANDATFGWHSSTGPDVDKRDGHVFANNVITSNEKFNRPLMFVWQPNSLCQKLSNPLLKQFVCNVFIQNNNKVSIPLMWWSPANNNECQISVESMDDFAKLYPELAKNNYSYKNYFGPLFKSVELGNYQLLSTFPNSESALEIPNEIKKYLDKKQKMGKYLGAYSPQ